MECWSYLLRSVSSSGLFTLKPDLNCILQSFRLSGLSPFMGDSDVDTFANITRADYDFDDDAFDAVTQDAKDFISSLLVHRKESRLTAKQCLDCSWLTQQAESLSNVKICTDKLKKFIIRRKWQVSIVCYDLCVALIFFMAFFFKTLSLRSFSLNFAACVS